MRGFCLWFTGLPAAGKTTLAEAVRGELEKRSRVITMLDGDVAMRQILSKGLGFSQDDRDTNVMRAGFVAGEIVKHGGIAICALISPYASTRRKVRSMMEELFVEVYVDTALQVCEARDPKGLYKRARAGEIQHVTGINDPYERPVNPELHLDGALSIDDNTVAVISYLQQRGLITRPNQSAALMIGRYQPFHEGHKALFEKALEAEGHVVIGVRETSADPNNPLTFDEVKRRIDVALSDYAGLYEVLRLPNITNVIYGRNVGYRITRVELSPEIESISASNIRGESIEFAL